MLICYFIRLGDLQMEPTLKWLRLIFKFYKFKQPFDEDGIIRYIRTK